MLMPALDLVRELRRAGMRITVVEGTLHVTAPAGVLSEALKQELVSRKAELMALFVNAVALLNKRGVRMFYQDGRLVVALWREADGREVRDAIVAVAHGESEVRFLNDPEADIPERYRRFVPTCVKEVWDAQGLPSTAAARLEVEAKARYLNRLFDSLGTAPGSSRITARTVLHGMLAKSAQPLP